ncbi:hypothetical protein VNO78_06734 [Psophocarpus tetragonolobus]|uniref:Uncharacterized protein n=1 Tax=Psophocarpus tetragonolobus TaxID=3891 RepID=A0AAN9SSE7_PSOTE
MTRYGSSPVEIQIRRGREGKNLCYWTTLRGEREKEGGTHVISKTSTTEKLDDLASVTQIETVNSQTGDTTNIIGNNDDLMGTKFVHEMSHDITKTNDLINAYDPWIVAKPKRWKHHARIAANHAKGINSIPHQHKLIKSLATQNHGSRYQLLQENSVEHIAVQLRPKESGRAISKIVRKVHL